VSRPRVLLGVALVAAVLGGLALATGSGIIAAVAGVGAIAAASLAARDRPSDAELVREPPVTVVVAPPVPAPAPAPGPVDAAGVLTEQYLEVTLQQRVAVARRALRPLSVVYLEVLDVDGGASGWRLDELVSATFGSTLRESDVVGRRGDGVYVFVLEDTGEDGAVWTAERIRRALSAATGHRRFRAGIASYPTHGLDTASLTTKASAALEAAREWKRDRIEVAAG
jgi:GGDEF domain-containing protein